jgi:hypothetical protein
MEEKRYNKVALLLVLLIGSYVLIEAPFVLSIYTYVFLRFSLFLLIMTFSFLMVLKNKNLKFLLILAAFFIQFLYYFWAGANLWETYTNFTCLSLAIVLLLLVKRSYSLKVLLIDFYFGIVLLFSVLSIISFITFHFELAPFELKAVGQGLDIYMSYHNYFLGYISPRSFPIAEIGRVCGFMFEPSYQAWFLSSNFFLVSKYLKDKKYLRFVQSVVLLGALSTFSTMVWIVLIVLFISMVVFKLFSLMGLKRKAANILYSFMIVLAVLTVFTVVNVDKLTEKFLTSSGEDRSNRIDISFLYLANASTIELIIGRGPGYIATNSDRGESNPIVKSLVENGIGSTVLVVIFIIYCTFRSKYYMIASLLWLNSVVIMFTPLFVINILICKWMDDLQLETKSM